MDEVDELIRQLNDSREWARKEAAERLGELKDPRAVEPLRERLFEDDDWGTRTASAEALGEIKDATIVPALIGALSSDDKFLRHNAIGLLGKIGGPGAYEPLIGLLEDDDENVPDIAIEALGNLRDSRAVPTLIGLLKGEDETTRDYAGEALWRIREAGIPVQLEEGSYLAREWEIRDMEGIADESGLSKLIGAIQEEGGIGSAAATKLAEFKDPRAVPPLIRLLKDSDPGTRYQVLYALGEIGDERAIGPVKEALGDISPMIQKNAVRAIGKLMGVKAIDLLMDILRDEFSEVQQVVIETFEEIGIGNLTPGEQVLCLTSTGGTEIILSMFPDDTLSGVRSALDGFVEKGKKRWSREELARTKRWIVRSYRKIAKAVAERKKKEMPGVLSEGTVPKPSDGKKMYRKGRLAKRT